MDNYYELENIFCYPLHKYTNNILIIQNSTCGWTEEEKEEGQEEKEERRQR